MPYVLPTFNLDVKIWHRGAVPPNPATAPADVTTVGNLSPGKVVTAIGFRASSGGDYFPNGWLINVILRLPAGTDIRSSAQGAWGDIVEVPAGTGRFYTCLQVDDMGKGFANEHRWAYIAPVAYDDPNPWPVPYP